MIKKIITTFIIIASFIVLTGCIKPQVKMTLVPGKDTIELGSMWVDAGALAVYRNKKLTITVFQEIDTEVIGEYVVTYQTTYNNVIYSIKRYVFVIDQTPPTAFLNPGIDTIIVGSPWVDAGITASDNSGIFTITGEGSVNTNQVGQYVITYHVTDDSDNLFSIVRWVNVIEE